MARYNETVAKAQWDALTSGQKESMQALTNEFVRALEEGHQFFPDLLENALRQTSGVLSNAKGNFQNIGGTYSSTDSQNRVPAPCTDTKALAEATDHGRRPLETPLVVPASELAELAKLDNDHSNLSNTNQSLTEFALTEIKEGGAPKLLEFVQVHNHLAGERQNQSDTGQQHNGGFNSQDSGHGL